MKHLIQSLAFSLAVAFAAPLFGQVHPAKLTINGVGLGSTYAQVLRALGKPVKDARPTREECIGAREKPVEYRGLSIHFMDGDSRDGKTFEVKSFEVTAGRWEVSGVKIGDGEAVVRRRFGRKYNVDNNPETGERSWSYDMGDAHGPGTTIVTFKNGKVVSIASAYIVC